MLIRRYAAKNHQLKKSNISKYSDEIFEHAEEGRWIETTIHMCDAQKRTNGVSVGERT